MCQKTFGFGTQPQLQHIKQLSITTLHYQSSDVGTVWSIIYNVDDQPSPTTKCVPTTSTAENNNFTIKALKNVRCLCFLGLLFSVGLRPRHVTVTFLSAKTNN